MICRRCCLYQRVLYGLLAAKLTKFSAVLILHRHVWPYHARHGSTLHLTCLLAHKPSCLAGRQGGADVYQTPEYAPDGPQRLHSESALLDPSCARSCPGGGVRCCGLWPGYLKSCCLLPGCDQALHPLCSQSPSQVSAQLSYSRCCELDMVLLKRVCGRHPTPVGTASTPVRGQRRMSAGAR